MSWNDGEEENEALGCRIHRRGEMFLMMTKTAVTLFIAPKPQDL